jgi:RNA polymerase sigma factor (sigma-70 family)
VSGAADFESLLAAHAAAIGRVAASYERDPARRQDLLQEIAIALWRALPGFRGESSARTFVLRIAHHRAVTHSMRRPPAGQPLDDAREVAAADPSPEAEVADRQRRRRLEESIRALPIALRQVLTLALEGLSNREVGDVLGVSENAVAIRLTRARQALRQLMTDGRESHAQPAEPDRRDALAIGEPPGGPSLRTGDEP